MPVLPVIIYTIFEKKKKERKNLFTAHRGLGFITLFIQYYSAICRPSDHTVGRPRAESWNRDGRSRGKDTNHETTKPPKTNLLLLPTFLNYSYGTELPILFALKGKIAHWYCLPYRVFQYQMRKGRKQKPNLSTTDLIKSEELSGWYLSADGHGLVQGDGRAASPPQVRQRTRIRPTFR